MTSRDAFEQARCRQPGARPGLWDVDAPKRDVARAATLCAQCPAAAPCATLAHDLGLLATGTWAGEFHPYRTAQGVDEGMMVFLAIFGPAAPTVHIPTPVQLTLDLDLTQQRVMQEAS